MEYLIKESGTIKSAHYWNGIDTACRMWSTGGLNQNKKWSVFPDAQGHPVCTMCLNNSIKSDKPYGSLMSGGICQCGGKLVYSAWKTIEEKKERLTCSCCGRTEYASTKKETEQPTLI